MCKNMSVIYTSDLYSMINKESKGVKKEKI